MCSGEIKMVIRWVVQVEREKRRKRRTELEKAKVNAEYGAPWEHGIPGVEAVGEEISLRRAHEIEPLSPKPATLLFAT